jgi:hypothetical protein
MRLAGRLRAGRLVSMMMVVLGASGAPALAQSDPPVRDDPPRAIGVRAAGMGGAFTAVADDGSAAYWNPAGLATGAFFSVLLDCNTLDRQSALLLAIGTPPLGLTYYRTTSAEVKGGPRSFVAHHAGVTVVQSVGGRLAVGATLKAVHGVTSPDGDAIASTKFDAELGVITTGSFARLGLSVHNLLQPEFASRDVVVRLNRRVRAGLAVNARQNTIVAADIDLTKTQTSRGDWRDVAVGIESHVHRAAWVRGGVRVNAAGGNSTGAAPIATIGGSYAVYGSVLADAQVSLGSSQGDRGWGAGLRFVF